MAEPESTEAYAARLCGHIVTSLTSRQRPVDAKSEALRIIEARDAAVANAVLDEFEARLSRYFSHARGVADTELAFLRAKYAAKGGG